jgi:SAM-dependent methyltransferase
MNALQGTSGDSRTEQKERQLFNRIGSSYSRKDVLLSSRWARRHRLEQTMRHVNVPLHASILELGCGAGWSAYYLTGKYDYYFGIDYSSKLIDIAKTSHRLAGVEFAVTNIVDFRPDRQFDIVFAIGVLHHSNDVIAIVNSAWSFLLPGGWLIVNEPRRGNPVVGAARWIRKRWDQDFSVDQFSLSCRELKLLFQRTGFFNTKVLGQGYLSTPFAEVCLPMQPLTTILSRFACLGDVILDKLVPAFLPLSWNVIAIGQKPFNPATRRLC